MKQLYLSCQNCIGGPEGDRSCNVAGENFGCFAGVPLELAQNVLGVDLCRRSQEATS